MAEPDLYNILGVTRTCNDGEIKKAYHKLAKTYHPDKNPDAGDKFKEISFAYEVLTDPEKRQTYDRHGLQGLKEGGGGGGGAGFGDIFGDLFGGMFGGGGSPFGFGGPGGGGPARRGSRRQRGEDTFHPLKVTLEDLYNGKTSKLQLSKTVICKKCKGQGGKSGATFTCRMCNGRGIKVTLRQLGPGMVQQMQSVCPECKGEGETIPEKDRCRDCHGKKVTQETKILEVNVDKGMTHNQKMPFRGEGDEQPGVEAGDVIIVLQEKEHDTFQRRGADLYVTYNLGLTEALCGFEFTIKHLDKRDLLIRNPKGCVIPPGSSRCVYGEGMPQHRNPFEKGNLYVKFEVTFPPNHFLEEPKFALLEKLLPARERADIPMGENTEEVDLQEFDPAQQGGNNARREAYGADDDDDEDGPPGGPGVQCAHQ